MKVQMVSVPEEYMERLMNKSCNFSHKDTRVLSVWLQLVGEVAVYQYGADILNIPKSVYDGRRGVIVGCYYSDTRLLRILANRAVQTDCSSSRNAEMYCARYLSNLVDDFILAVLKEAEDHNTTFEYVLAEKKRNIRGSEFSRRKYCEFVNELE